jgi:hypothetical protein
MKSKIKDFFEFPIMFILSLLSGFFSGIFIVGFIGLFIPEVRPDICGSEGGKNCWWFEFLVSIILTFYFYGIYLKSRKTNKENIINARKN